MMSKLQTTSSRKVLVSNMDLRKIISDILSVLALLSFVAAAFLVTPILGLVVIGLALLAISYFMR